LQGNEREVIGKKKGAGTTGDNQVGNQTFVAKNQYEDGTHDITKGTSEWEGWGTALKPAHEPICMARKPLAEKTVAQNVLKYGTGGINIDESRVGLNGEKPPTGSGNKSNGATGIDFHGGNKEEGNETSPLGRFPANLIHDNSEEVRECFPETKSGAVKQFTNNGANQPINLWGGMLKPTEWSQGNASRFFKSIIYQAKASKSERNKGLDWQVLISIMGSYLFPITTECTEKPDQNQLHLLDIEASQQKGGLECEIKIKKGKDLNISLFEKLTTDQYLNECKSIISTTTGWTMILAISNWLHLCITKEYTADVNWEIEFGENLVENAEWWKKLTTTIKGKIEFLLDVKPVVSEMQLIIKEKENKNFHSTVKPVALMEYLIKMVTPKGGIVLDPFAGSGSTLVAAKQNGYQYIGCELTEEYIPIIEARLNAVEETKEKQTSLF
jgi:hypothetical protein